MLIALYFNILLAVVWLSPVGVLCLFPTVPWDGLYCVYVAFSGHTHLLFHDGPLSNVDKVLC